MNQQQIKYTIERVGQIENKKLAALRVECTVPAKWLTDEQRLQLVLTKKVKLKDGLTCLRRRDDIGDVFDFSKYEWSERKTDDFEKRQEAIKAEASRIKDEIMLGDHVAALELLRKFEA